MSRFALGIDVGGTKIAGALVDDDGEATRHRTVPTPRSPDGADPGAAATAELVRTLIDEASADDHDLVGVGIGIPEFVAPDGGASRVVLAWPEDATAVIRSAVESASAASIRTVIESDVRCAAIAEHRIGHGRGRSSCLFVSIGTGISHALVVGNRIWCGQRGEAIALGELRVAVDDLVLPDAAATVEEQASGSALERVAAALDVPARSEHPDLDTARRRAGAIVGAAVADAVALLDPEVVVVGGGLGTATGTYTRALAVRYRELTARRPAAPPLLTSALGERAGCIGAGLVALGS